MRKNSLLLAGALLAAAAPVHAQDAAADIDAPRAAEPVAADFAPTPRARLRTLPMSNSRNPAASGLNGGGFRLGAPVQFGVGVEFGVPDGFLDDFEDLEDRVDALSDDVDRAQTVEDIERLRDQLIDLEGDGNAFLHKVADNTYLRARGRVGIPMLPVTFGAGFAPGTLEVTSGGNIAAEARLLVGDQPLDLGNFNRDGTPDQITRDEDGDFYVNGELLEPSFRDTALLVDGGAHVHFGIGYAQPVYSYSRGSIVLGGRLNVHNVTLTRQFELVDEEDEDAAALARDELDDTTNGTALGLDLGVAWESLDKRYRVGAEVRNLNAPSFDYPEVCGPAGTDDACIELVAAANRDSTFTLDRQLAVEAVAFTDSGRGAVRAHAELNSVTDMGGGEQQWVGIEGAYRFGNAWMPIVRAGYEVNLEDEQLDRVMLGLTFLQTVDLHLAASTKTVEVEGNTVPRYLELGLSVSRRF